MDLYAACLTIKDRIAGDRWPKSDDLRLKLICTDRGGAPPKISTLYGIFFYLIDKSHVTMHTCHVCTAIMLTGIL